MRALKKEKRAVSRLSVKHLRKLSWKAILIAILATVLAWAAWTYLSSRTNQAQLFNHLQAKEAELNTKLEELDKTKLDAKQLEEKKQQLENDKADLTKQLESKRARIEADKVYAASLPVPVPKPVQTAPVSSCGDNTYANYIYMHESGCSLWNPNTSSGACGLGQAWPCSKLPCGADYACQNAYFTKYANDRYGGWYGAYIFWLAHKYW